MPTITENGPFTILMEYEVEAGRQREMIAGVTEIIARRLAPNPGFISASFHAVEGGTRVLNYAQYVSREVWQSLASGGPDNPMTAAIIEVITRCGGRRTSVEPIEVVRVVEGAGAMASA
jgi:hypothetical protein